MKNIGNNLLNRKKFVFPQFNYGEGQRISINCPAGFIQWKDLYDIYDLDKQLEGHMRKAPKLSYQALHPGNNKQNVPLAIALVYETTVAAAKSYFSERPDLANFLYIFHVWWTISNSKVRFTPNFLGNAAVPGDMKTDFFGALADWIEEWCSSPAFKLTAQTKSALIYTLRAQDLLIDELLLDGYEFVLTARLQSDPIERRFSQYRQMSGDRFLVSLREVLTSERILKCKSLIKENINFWDENLQQEEDPVTVVNDIFDPRWNEIAEATLDDHTREVATTVSGYVARKLTKRSKCEECKMLLKSHEVDLDNDSYLKILSRRELVTPSKRLDDFVCDSFDILDLLEKDLLASELLIQKVAIHVLHRYGTILRFVCENHEEWGFKFAIKIVVNIFFNNLQKQAKDTVRKD